MAGKVERTVTGPAIRPLLTCGALIFLGYFGLFAILQSPILWYALRPDPIRSLFPDAFGPINELFPNAWVNLERTDPLALFIAVPMYVLVLVLITAPVLYLVRWLSRRRRAFAVQAQVRAFLAIVLAVTVAIMLVLTFARGLLSTDIYSYAWYSRILAVHGASPMTHAPAEFPPDPEGAFYWIGWPDEPSVYGPVWTVVSTAFFKLGNDPKGAFSAQLLSLRVLADLAHLVNAWLVWSIAGLVFASRSRHALRWRRLGHIDLGARLRRGRLGHLLEGRGSSLGPRAAALIFYVWNPLLLIEFAGSGHNDVLMLTFVLLAVWLHLKGLWQLAAAALMLATLVKLPAIFFIPGYLWYLFWQQYSETPQGTWPRRASSALIRPLSAAAVMLATAAALYLPFWEGPRTLLPPFSGPASRLYLHTIAYDIWRNAPQIVTDLAGITDGRSQFMESVRAFLDASLRLAFMALLGAAAVALTWRARTFRRLLISWGWLGLIAAIAQGWYWPWYASWCIALAAIAPSRRLRIATSVFAISSLLLYPEEQVLAKHFVFFLDWSGIFIMLPPLIYIALSWLAERRRMRPMRQRPSSIENRPPAEHRRQESGAVK